MASIIQHAEPFSALSPVPEAMSVADEQERILLSALADGDTGRARGLAADLTQRFPGRGVGWKVSGALLWGDGRTADALAAMENSVRLLPDDAEAHCNLGVSLAKMDRFAEAETRLRKAIDIDPSFATAHYRLGMTYSLQTRLPEALSSLRAGLALRTGYADGDDAQNFSNLLFISSHLGADPEALFAEHRHFGECFEDSAAWPRHANTRDAGRRLKIGFVSGDLREHAVAHFIEPILAHLAGSPHWELHAYSSCASADVVNLRLRGHMAHWQEISDWSESQLAARITADGIDILIDLSGHTALNRLGVFARKPAPLQVSWIGYPGTTGLRAMDYYLADRRWLPEQKFAAFFTEKLVYLPDRWAFQPHAAAPEVAAPPALSSGRLTFGSFNRPDKLSEATILQWSKLLRELPDTRLMLGGIRLQSQRDALLVAFAAQGVSSSRIDFRPPGDMADHLALYRHVDICLDTTPFNGGTMTLHALWMGVPTLTVPGETPMARAGAGILENLGLGEFVARDTSEMIAKARYWAEHPGELAALRAGMRARLLSSPVGQPALIAAHVEAALRHMWKLWCDAQRSESFDTTEVLAAINASTLDTACSKAMEVQVAGHLDLAQQLYGAILRAAPQHAAANYGLGMLHVRARRPVEGLPHLKAALQAQLEMQDYWLGYLEALILAGQNEAARNILALGAKHGLAGPAVDDFAQRLEAQRNLEILEAERSLRSMLDQHRHTEALAAARGLTERFPNRGFGWKTLGALLMDSGGDAIVALQTAVRVLPEDAVALADLGLASAKAGQFETATAALHRALELEPEFAAAHYRLGITYEMQGRFAEAAASLRRGLGLRTGQFAREDAQCFSNLLFLTSHDASVNASELYDEHRRFGKYLESHLPQTQSRRSNNRNPERCLNIGFVSGDLYDHSVAKFLEPALARLARRRSMRLHAYYTNTVNDDVTRRLQAHMERWSAVRSLSDAELEAQIRSDRIDVLIDLSGHTRMNRLTVFAGKPAPIQASWLGYPGTTGLRAMDYYLGDRRWLPPGQFDRQFTEKLVYLPDRWAFEPNLNAPPVNPLPALASGHLTFGSFHRAAKINSFTIGLWSDLLLALPQSRLLLVGGAVDGGQDHLLERFTMRGIDPGRLTFHDRCPLDRYLALHHQVDIALDSQPYAGATTTMHSLSMGVPTLTLAGGTSMARAAAGILANIDLDAFVARDADDWIAKARYWATHARELGELRAGMRERLTRFPVGQPDLIAAHFEAAIRHMWRRWCAHRPAISFDTMNLGLAAAR
jgi:predicted O-linked N-acetylglucosamine transferase (SPINDLY family)